MRKVLAASLGSPSLNHLNVDYDGHSRCSSLYEHEYSWLVGYGREFVNCEAGLWPLLGERINVVVVVVVGIVDRDHQYQHIAVGGGNKEHMVLVLVSGEM